MEVRFSAEVLEKINRAAAHHGQNAEALVNEAVERFLEYDEWFDRQVKGGLAGA